MRRLIFICVPFFLMLVFVQACAAAEGRILRTSPDCEEVRIKIVKTIELPKGYHEGLYVDGMNIVVSNGKRGGIWVVDKERGEVVSNIRPAGNFTEVVTAFDGGDYLISDWQEKEIYRAALTDGRLNVKAYRHFDTAHPAGAVWAYGRVYLITWTRGVFGTRFALIVMDRDFNTVDEVAINEIQDPSQISWDGRDLWISSWHNRKVYRISVSDWKITGYIRTKKEHTTGIAWDNGALWFTATHGDLYKAEVLPVEDAVSKKREVGMEIKVTSPAFKSGEMIPKKYTCDADELSPPITWSGVPATAKSIVVVCDDPDAPMGTFTHWVIFNIPPDSKGLPEGVPQEGELPDGSRQCRNDARTVGYCGPCPPSGIHRYYFKVFALDSVLGEDAGSGWRELLRAMEGRIIAKGEVMGRYKR